MENGKNTFVGYWQRECWAWCQALGSFRGGSRSREVQEPHQDPGLEVAFYFVPNLGEGDGQGDTAGWLHVDRGTDIQIAWGVQ